MTAWGWKRKDTGGWEVHWTTLPEATQACRDLLNVDARRGVAKEDVNVSKQHFDALPFATVVDYVLKTKLAVNLSKNILY